MSKEFFVDKNFKPATMRIIAQATQIIDEYLDMGFSLTLRQLYYQFVARDLISNTQQSYKRLGGIINDARLAGLIDWESIEDRTRNLKKNLHLNGPRHAIQVVRDQYGIDMWANQPKRVEVWIEKEALVGVIERVCTEMDVPFFACRGYVSQSEQWRAYKRAHRNRFVDQDTVVLHLGDHDPSGIDMTRDNQDRLDLFMGGPGVTVERIALTMDQIDEYGPPPNPAKVTDSRWASYTHRYGYESWELDALDPTMLQELILEKVKNHRDEEAWLEKTAQLRSELATLDTIIAELD